MKKWWEQHKQSRKQGRKHRKHGPCSYTNIADKAEGDKPWSESEVEMWVRV